MTAVLTRAGRPPAVETDRRYRRVNVRGTEFEFTVTSSGRILPRGHARTVIGTEDYDYAVSVVRRSLNVG